MVGRKRSAGGSFERRLDARVKTAGSPSTSGKRSAARGSVPDVYREMLAEAGSEIRRQSQDTSERPLKRKRPGERSSTSKTQDEGPSSQKLPVLPHGESEDEEDGIDFEDVALPAPNIQTIVRESEDEDDEDDDEIQFEDVELAARTLPGSQAEAPPQDLSLNLTAHKAAMDLQRPTPRRKAISKAEKDRRVEAHKLHLLCMLAHVERRNRWCNDAQVKAAINPMLSDVTISYLTPSTDLPQFGQTNSLKEGLLEAGRKFRTHFTITERGLRRALWAETEEDLQDVRVLGSAYYSRIY